MNNSMILLSTSPWVRYEDIARFPVQKARELYSFLGMVLDQSVEDWILNNTRGSSDLSSRHKFTTVRDSAANAENWRVKLSFDMVVYTQTVCQPLLDILGYKKVFHPKELRNFSHSLVEDRMFLPFFWTADDRHTLHPMSVQETMKTRQYWSQWSWDDVIQTVWLIWISSLCLVEDENKMRPFQCYHCYLGIWAALSTFTIYLFIYFTLWAINYLSLCHFPLKEPFDIFKPFHGKSNVTANHV